MSSDKVLADGLAAGNVNILDGAIGTEMQAMGVPMNSVAWAAMGLETHPYTVRRMHERYIEAGADIITTNTYSSARHNLEPLGLADKTTELNLRAVALAHEARERAAKGRPVWIAGAVSNFGLLTGGEDRHALHRFSSCRSALTTEQSKVYLEDQAAILAESGVDFLIVESTGSQEHRKWILEACRKTGLSVWTGFRCRLDQGDPIVRIGYASATPFEEGLAEVAKIGTEAVAIFHSLIDHTGPAIAVAKRHWKGPLVVYPEAERQDYTAVYRDHSVENKVSPAEYAKIARGWVDEGVQMVGCCCGIGVEYIRPLREALPRRVS